MPVVKKLPLISFGKTDVGRKRTYNEDNYSIFEEENLYIVADGMGGHKSGEVASKIAIESLRNFFQATSEDPEITWPYKLDYNLSYAENRLITGLKLANLRIYEAARKEKRYRGMGTTIVCLSFIESGVYIGHVGDSRVYKLQDGRIEQLTEDHSLLNDYIKMKKLTPEEIKNFPHKNVIVRALGMRENVKVDIIYNIPKQEDIFLLCSDGLFSMVPDQEISEIIYTYKDDLTSACTKLIERANEYGGTDNITTLLVKCLKDFA